MEAFFQKASQLVWGRGTLFLVLFTGGYYTLMTGFFPIRRAGLIFRETVGSILHPPKEAGIKPFDAMSAALGGTMGVGNLLGVAAAIAAGGPGAVLWIWVGALAGMMTKYAEVTLALRYRVQIPGRGSAGGPMYYMEQGLRCRPLGLFFASSCALGSFGTGNLTQGCAAASALRHSFGVPLWAAGFGLGVFCFLTGRGGAQKLVKLSARLVPLMSSLYLGGAAVILWQNREQILSAFAMIFSGAVSPAGKGIGLSAGFLSQRAMAVGISRGIFTNEAGLGSAPMAHACARTDLPARQGLWGIMEVFLDTMVVCTVTALVILSTGANGREVPPAQMTALAFSSVFGRFGAPFIALSLTLFAAASMAAWCLYGQCALNYLRPGRSCRWYAALFALASFWGCIMDTSFAWATADVLNGCMLLPNMIALLLLSPQVFFETKRLEALENSAKT